MLTNEMGKMKKLEDKKIKSETSEKERIIEVEKYLKENIVQRHSTVDDLTFYDNIPSDIQGLVSNLRTALKLEKTLENKNISNKIYIRSVLKKLKEPFEDFNIFMAYLLVQNLNIGKSEIYFSIALTDMADEYHKISLLSIPLRYFKTNMKIITKVIQLDKDFWKDIL